MRILALIVFSVVVAASSAMATSSEHKIKAFGGSEVAIVWKDGDAMSKGFKLIQADVHRTNPGLLLPLISCVISLGETFAITDFGFGSSTILVTSSKNAGCEGDPQTEFID